MIRSVPTLLCAALLPVGCATRMAPEVGAIRPLDTVAGVTVLFTPHFARDTGPALGREMTECVSTALEDAASKRFVPSQVFYRAVFPGLDPEAAPLSPESLGVLVGHSEFRQRVARAGVRYLVVVGGGTLQPSDGWGGCIGGYGGAACVWFLIWKRESTLWASVIDLDDGTVAERTEVLVSGRPFVGVVGVFPVGLPSFTESWGCRRVAQEIVRRLSGEGPLP